MLLLIASKSFALSLGSFPSLCCEFAVYLSGLYCCNNKWRMFCISFHFYESANLLNYGKLTLITPHEFMLSM